MRPLFSLWSDYGTPARKYRLSAAARGARPRIIRKIFLTAVIVTAAVIGARELYGQAGDKRGLLEPGGRPQSPVTPSANATGRRSAAVAAIPLSPQPAPSMESVASPAPVSAPEPSPPAVPVMAAAISDDHAIPPALAAVPGAQARAGALPRPPAALAARKSADGPGSVAVRRVVHVVHRSRGDGRGFAGYAEAIARLGHSKELRAALQMFL